MRTSALTYRTRPLPLPRARAFAAAIRANRRFEAGAVRLVRVPVVPAGGRWAEREELWRVDYGPARVPVTPRLAAPTLPDDGGELDWEMW